MIWNWVRAVVVGIMAAATGAEARQSEVQLPSGVRGTAISTSPSDPSDFRVLVEFQIGDGWIWEEHSIEHEGLGWVPDSTRLATRERTLIYNFGQRRGTLAPGLPPVPWRGSGQLAYSPIAWSRAVRERVARGDPIGTRTDGERAVLQWDTPDEERITIWTAADTGMVERAEIEHRRGRQVTGLSQYEYLDWSRLSDGSSHPLRIRSTLVNKVTGLESREEFSFEKLEPLPTGAAAPEFRFPKNANVADMVENVLRDSNLAVIGPLEVTSQPPTAPPQAARWPYVAAAVILLAAAGAIYQIRRKHNG